METVWLFSDACLLFEAHYVDNNNVLIWWAQLV